MTGFGRGAIPESIRFVGRAGSSIGAHLVA
jgi:hypothetical protein